MVKKIWDEEAQPVCMCESESFGYSAPVPHHSGRFNSIAGNEGSTAALEPGLSRGFLLHSTNKLHVKGISQDKKPSPLSEQAVHWLTLVMLKAQHTFMSENVAKT